MLYLGRNGSWLGVFKPGWLYYHSLPMSHQEYAESSAELSAALPKSVLRNYVLVISSVQFSSFVQSCLTLCSPMDCSTTGLAVHHQWMEFTQTHVHWVGDAIQPPHLLLSPSPPNFNLSQHQGLFKWLSSSHQVAKILKFQLQHQSFQWILRTDFLQDGLVWSPWGTWDSQESFPIPQFKSINSSALSFLYSPTLTTIHDYWKNHSFD